MINAIFFRSMLVSPFYFLVYSGGFYRPFGPRAGRERFEYIYPDIVFHHLCRHQHFDCVHRPAHVIKLDALQEKSESKDPVWTEISVPLFPKGIENLFGCFGICFPPSAPVRPIVHQARPADLLFGQAFRRVARTGFLAGMFFPPPPTKLFHHFRFIAAREQGDEFGDTALLTAPKAVEDVLATGLVSRRKVQVVLAIRREPVAFAERAIGPVVAVVGLAVANFEAMLPGHLDDIRKHAWQRASPS